MAKASNLVIVESPAKAKTIEKFLGADYTVMSCFGHVRDLPKRQLSIDVKNGFKPEYEIYPEKKSLVAQLGKAAKEAKYVWLASDEDREGEAIAWHLEEVLKLDPSKTKRIVFNEITKSAILHAIENPRELNYDLVDAQQARRILDRLVGYEISPILWKKVKPNLSAGRVQSVAVRLVVEREQEIKNFQEESAYKVVASFGNIAAELDRRFASKEEATAFLQHCASARFQVDNIEVKPSKKTPAPPFTTSTLQQEASRKLGFSVVKTMYVAQQLYEEGYITYMRTDSVTLSQFAHQMIREEILEQYGERYVKDRFFTTKTKGAQEAHEAIRPTSMQRKTISSDPAMSRLYELIWKRTLASQMSDAEIEKTQLEIGVSGREEKFVAKGEVVLFDGFLGVYMASVEDDKGEELLQSENASSKQLPKTQLGQVLNLDGMVSRQVFSSHSPRYSEASLVKKMEDLGIGRPSTYAPTISTILKREYVVKEDREGRNREYVSLELKGKEVKEKRLKEKTGSEKAKLFPTDVGGLVNQFLMENFSKIMDYNFTAKVEQQFDEIASGHKKWNVMIGDFYKPFHLQIEETTENSEKVSGERLLGVDPVSGKNIYVKLSRFGAVVQKGDTQSEEKPVFAGLKKGQSIETITFEEALDLLKLPRVVGSFEEKEMVASIGRFGPYIRHDGIFVSIPKGEDPLEISAERAVELILEKREAEKSKFIKSFDEEPDLMVLNGRYGPYIAYRKQNFKIPKDKQAQDLTLEDCRKIIEDAGTAPKKGSSRRTSVAKTAEKKTTKKTSRSTPKK